MFTGIIQEIGQVRSALKSGGNLLLTIRSEELSSRLEIGSSISINGACQTVVDHGDDHFTMETIEETISRTNLGDLRVGSFVNLETPLTPESMLDGHLVQGHIDCTGRVQKISPVGGSTVYSIDFPDKYGKFLIEKGSIAIDGVSLTLINASQDLFEVAIIPHTIENTLFKYRRVGDIVNLEFDMVAKFIERIVSPVGKGLTIAFLKEHGFG